MNRGKRPEWFDFWADEDWLKEKYHEFYEGVRCHAGKDGDCIWTACPQLRDGEPKRSGRHCPFDTEKDDEYRMSDAEAADYRAMMSTWRVSDDRDGNPNRLPRMWYPLP